VAGVERVGRRKDAVMCITIDSESKRALKEYCALNDFDSLSQCIRYIIKMYFMILARKRYLKEKRH
jgi:hypothetical protein